ncbi:hypothetical protein BXT84_01930 [Sulfobacillus thermotolerans]|uniref:DUF4129 domain-containing protein n=1 Tax=Sulfobacillus thermotolerans TaxID=338644 RepID=A0ABN5GXM7_9FIRM|nr:hypothetical protein BXT84_01930 [Sulfobacillus thermotolerans]
MRRVLAAGVDLSWMLLGVEMVSHNLWMVGIAGLFYLAVGIPGRARMRTAGVAGLALSAVVLGHWVGVLVVGGILGIQRVRYLGRYVVALVAWTILAWQYRLVGQIGLLLVAGGGLLVLLPWPQSTWQTALRIVGGAWALAMLGAGMLWVIPWTVLVANTLGWVGAGAAGLLLWLVPHLHRKETATRHITHPFTRPWLTHATRADMSGVVVMIALLLLMGIVLLAWRLRLKSHPVSSVSKTSDMVVIESLPKGPPIPRPARLTPVRHVVSRGLRQAAQHHQGKRQGETLRQWLTAKGFGEWGRTIAEIYEQVRYGMEDDTKTRANEVQRLWRKVTRPR